MVSCPVSVSPTQPLTAAVLERFFSRKERQKLFHSWVGSASMWLKVSNYDPDLSVPTDWHYRVVMPYGETRHLRQTTSTNETILMENSLRSGTLLCAQRAIAIYRT